jgi:CheY-like chemotaxis protein
MRHPLTILVVDDSADLVESEADLLAFQGHVVRTALNGEDALQLVDAQPPDVVLLDIRLPGMDGYAVARQIRARCATYGKRPFVVAVTGCGNELDRQNSAEAGFDLHLVKPVDPALLIGLLERYRRLLAPTIPASDLDSLTEDPPDPPSRMPFFSWWHPV